MKRRKMDNCFLCGREIDEDIYAILFRIGDKEMEDINEKEF